MSDLEVIGLIIGGIVFIILFLFGGKNGAGFGI